MLFENAPNHHLDWCQVAGQPNRANMRLEEIIAECKDLAFDLHFKRPIAWKNESPGKVLVGFMPIYFPREIIHAAGGLAVGIMGSGDRMQIVRGDAYYQSYICHIPRGIVEMALHGNLNAFDGFVFPSICDVIRNLSGMFRLMGKGKFAKYLDYPQNFSPETGGVFYRSELQHVINKVEQITGKKVTPENLNKSISLFNENRKLIERIYDIRTEYPWRLSTEDTYYILRAGLLMPVEEHNEKLREAINHISQNVGEPMDNIRVVISGSFCEQPPIGLIKTIEKAGCYIVDDDLMLGSRWIKGDVAADTDDPLGSLVDAYLTRSVFSSAVYDVENPKGELLVAQVKRRKADGVIFAAASFCDPALLDQPILVKACDGAGIRHICFQFHENTGQFKVIKEQVGAFSDSIKLWEEEVFK